MIYIGLAYDVLHSSESANEIAKNLKNGKVIWNSQRYQSLVEARTIEESDMTKDVAEGIYTCKCGSKKTQSIQIQTRSGDEGMTSFITCVMCKKMWKINN
jgi:DNA-directed RNA polymerase subunit M/transcription elongation factor TFIIS